VTPGCKLSLEQVRCGETLVSQVVTKDAGLLQLARVTDSSGQPMNKVYPMQDALLVRERSFARNSGTLKVLRNYS
jgi:hypothetical protein